ncbi:MAG: hypothetical protein FWE92_03340 [Defluviitaleaceae bacterium]|nr:hypothetical protein [Defluviitaleaceae bacterium]
MRSVLEEFAYGNISPEVQTFKRNSKYGQAMATLCSTEEQLISRLNDEEKDIFQEHIDAQGEVNQLTAVRNLVYGYKLGVLMTAEAFIKSGELISGEEE